MFLEEIQEGKEDVFVATEARLLKELLEGKFEGER